MFWYFIIFSACSRSSSEAFLKNLWNPFRATSSRSKYHACCNSHNKYRTRSSAIAETARVLRSVIDPVVIDKSRSKNHRLVDQVFESSRFFRRSSRSICWRLIELKIIKKNLLTCVPSLTSLRLTQCEQCSFLALLYTTELTPANVSLQLQMLKN